MSTGAAAVETDDLLALELPFCDLRVWSKDVDDARALLRRTLATRRGTAVTPRQAAWLTHPGGRTEALDITSEPVLFENRTYELRFVLDFGVEIEVGHVRHDIGAAFRRTRDEVRGWVNFGNDVGRFTLELVVRRDGGTPTSYRLALEVHPTKLDMETDLAAIHHALDQHFPLWRFAMGRATELGQRRTRAATARFLLLWMAQFRALLDELERSVRVVCNAPHHRLHPHTRAVRAEQLRGKLPPRMEERVAAMVADGVAHRRVEVVSRRLSVDTPENRFIRSVLLHCEQRLAVLRKKVERAVEAPAGKAPRLSRAALNEVESWQQRVSDLLSHRFFRGVGTFAGMERESLVLQERAGYRGVYRVWQDLRAMLGSFGDDATLSMKSIAEIYEVWCFLEVRTLLTERLGFQSKDRPAARMDRSGLELKIGYGGAVFHLTRGSATDGTLLRASLFHQRRFSPSDWSEAPRSHLNVHEPDILLEVTFSSGEVLTWVFDAKYRLHDGEGADANLDLVPPDAINQMHRYRDAIVQRTRGGSASDQRRRHVVGAFCLYPGWYPDAIQDGAEGSSPYANDIHLMGIGAFPVLPTQRHTWLVRYLENQLGGLDTRHPAPPGPDGQLARWPTRIVPAGLELRRPGGMVLVAHIGPDRTDAYRAGFRDGDAPWFHLREEALARGGIPLSAVDDITHCAIAHPDASGASSITHLYPVEKRERLDRSGIDAAQAGLKEGGMDPAPQRRGPYLLFKLAAGERLSAPIAYKPSGPFRAWLTSPAALRSGTYRT